MTNKVNLGWQMAATLFLPTGLYAFKKIKKLGSGIMIYVATYVIFVLGITIPLLYWNIVPGGTNINQVDTNALQLSYGIVTTIFAAINIFLPIFFIHRWSNEYNSKIKLLS